MTKDNHYYSKPVLLLYAITMLYYTVPYIMMVVLPIYMARLGVGAEEIGFVMGVTSLATMLMRPVAGGIIDKFGSKRVFRFALIVDPIALLGYFIPFVPLFALCRVAIGVGGSFFSTSMQVLSIKLVSAKYRQGGLSLYSLASRFPEAFGPAIALYFVNLVNIKWILGAAVCLSILTYFFGRKLYKYIGSIKTQPMEEEYNEEWKNGFLLISALTIFLTSLTNGAATTFLPLYMFSVGEKNASLYFLVFSLTLLVFRAVFSRRTSGKTHVPSYFILVLSICCALSTWLIAHTSQLPVFLLSAFFQGLAFSSLYPTLSTLISFRSSAKTLAMRMSLFTGAADFGIAMGSFIMGIILHYTSYYTMFLSCSIAAFLAGILFFIFANIYKVYLQRKP